ncbi:PARP10 [Branchiostoma lanceolatum]|uniref:PARP10 protein n=1 Tax=Branchiostoma lanceolatum TaxID=7740 RepID=A0A8K0A570_BRALA|nr:PARP10 [Branchiostoma lanceolatum]
MAASQQDKTVFLCHAGENKAFVRQLVERLETDGLEKDQIFYDEISLQPGDELDNIIKVIESPSLKLFVFVVNVLPAKLKLEFVQKSYNQMLDKADTLFDNEIFKDEERFKKAEKLFDRYQAKIESIIPRNCFIFNLRFFQPCNVDEFYHDHFRLGPTSLSAALSHLLITDLMRAAAGGEELMVRVEVRYDDYIRVRTQLCTAGTLKATSVDNLTTMVRSCTERNVENPNLEGLDLAITSTQDLSFLEWVSYPDTRHLANSVRQQSQQVIALERRLEIGKQHAGIQETIVNSLQKEVTHLKDEYEVAQKVLMNKTEEIKQLHETNRDLERENEELRNAKVKYPITGPEEVSALRGTEGEASAEEQSTEEESGQDEQSASPPTTGENVHYMSSGQPTSSIPFTGASSSPSFPYHQQSSSSESHSWGSPRTGSPVSLPSLHQDRNRSQGYLSDQESSVQYRQTPKDLSDSSDEESIYDDDFDLVSSIGIPASGADSFVEAAKKVKVPSSVIVSGFTSAPDEELLGLYFESERRSGGGKVEKIEARGNEVIVTFKDPAVTQRILARNHELPGQTLRVKEVTSSPAEATPDMDTSVPSNITIQVSGFTSCPNEDTMMLYFENKKRSGGGDIQEIQVRDNKVFIVFNDPSVAQHVLSREHRLDDTILKLKEVQPRSLDNTRLLVKGFKEGTTKETLSLYLENIGDDEVITIDYSTQSGVALVTLNTISDFDRMVTKAQSRSLEGQQLTLERVPITDAIIVTGLPDTVSRDLLALYFESEKRSSGGLVADIKMDSSTGTAVVQFDDANR